MTSTRPTDATAGKADGQELENILDPSFEAFVRRSRLGAQAALGDNAKKKEQQRLRLERQAAKASLQDKIAIANLAEEVGLTSMPMSGLQLRGALCSIVEAAASAAKLAEFEAAGQAWLDASRPGRDPHRLPVFVTAASIGAEMTEECLRLRLRRMPVPRGFTGKLTLPKLIELGTTFMATIQLLHAGEEQLIVERGSVDEALVAHIRSELDGSGSSLRAPDNDAEKRTSSSPASEDKPAANAVRPRLPRPAGGFTSPLQRPASAARR